MGKREQEGDRLDQMRREPLEQQRALGECLAHQAQVELLQVAQAAVNQLARPRRRARAEVPRLDQAGREAPGDGIQGDTRSDDAAAHHQHLQFLASQGVERGRALGRAEPGCGQRRIAAAGLPVARLLTA
jgi:hypothetical protein